MLGRQARPVEQKCKHVSGRRAHQIVVQYFNGYQHAAAVILTVIDAGPGTNTPRDVSSSFVHDPAGPCNADCADGGCNTDQQYCVTCRVGVAVGGVCTSSSSVTPWTAQRPAVVRLPLHGISTASAAPWP